MIGKKSKPEIKFESNKLLQQVFKQYRNTFALTLDTCDFIEHSDLKLFRKFVRKEMKKSLRKVRVVARRRLQWDKHILKEKSILNDKFSQVNAFIKQNLPELRRARCMRAFVLIMSS